MAFVSDIRNTDHGFGAWVSAQRKAFGESRAKRRVFNQTFNELNSLSDRDLLDLGIGRSSIRSIAYEAAYGK